MKEIPKRGNSKFVVVIASMILVLVSDQLTKQLILESFQMGESREIVSSLFNLVLVFNKGAAFGFLSGVSEGLRQIILGATTVLALGTVIYLLVYDYFEDRIARTALGMILGGAVGNIIDRVRLGEVVDFLDFYYGNYHWPAFNVADSAICVGVFILLFRKPREAVVQEKC